MPGQAFRDQFGYYQPPSPQQRNNQPEYLQRIMEMIQESSDKQRKSPGIGFPPRNRSNEHREAFQNPSPRPNYDGNPQANSNFNQDKYYKSQHHNMALSDKNEDSYSATFYGRRVKEGNLNQLSLNKQAFSPFNSKERGISKVISGQTPSMSGQQS